MPKVMERSRRLRGKDQTRLLDIIDEARGASATGQELVLQSLRRAILRGALEPGARLRQEGLAGIFGTSRIPIREALRALEYEGLVTSEPHHGFSVASLDPDDLDEVYELRTLLEAHAVQIVLPLLTDEDLAELESLYKALHAAESADDQLAAREHFYRRLYSVSGRPRLVGLIMRLHQDVARLLRWATVEHSGLAHEQFFDAVRSRDPDRASRHLRDHYRRVGALIRRRLKEEAALERAPRRRSN
jgi:DNA-binding GntR family transcriptional regulator